MRAPDITGRRLLRYDGRIAINTARATFAGWHDRLIAAIVLLAALAALRSWIADRSWTTAAWTALGAAAVVGIGAGRLVRERLAFNRLDGLLAADALHPPTCRRYMTAWHGVGIALLTAITLIARPSLLVVSVAGYLAGVLVAGLTDGLRIPGRMAGKARQGWTIRAWLRRPSAGVAAAMILLLSLLPARTLSADALVAIVGVEAVLLALILTAVDDGVVRFMTIAGHGSWGIVLRHTKALAPFVILATAGCWFAVGPAATVMVAAASMGMLLLLILRVLAYRLHGKRFAHLLVSIVAGLLVLMAYSTPVVLPVIVLVVLWRLQRRGSAKTWWLA